MNNIKVSKLHLVDLAGSERQKDTNAEDVRLKVTFVSKEYSFHESSIFRLLEKQCLGSLAGD